MRGAIVKSPAGRAHLGAALALTGLLAGCGSSSSGGSAASPSAGSSSGAAASSAPASPTPPAATTSAPAGGNSCATIDLAAATALLGGTPKQLAAPDPGPDAGDGVKITKLDGCSYTGTDPSLGYDVNLFENLVPVQEFIAAAKAQMANEPVTPFDVGLGDDSVGFTVAVGPKTMVRIEVAKGQSTVAVVSTGSDEAKAKAVALEAVKRLLPVAR